MTKKNERFLVSAGAADQDYGLYVMEKISPHHAKDAHLAYYYDSDTFFSVKDQERQSFVPPLELKFCKDEFGNQFSGESLLNRIRHAIQAYEEELPAYVKNVLSHPLHDDGDEQEV